MMKENTESEYERQLREEIEQRISKMESLEYVGARRFGKRDYLVVLCTVILCLASLVAGAYL